MMSRLISWSKRLYNGCMADHHLMQQILSEIKDLRAEVKAHREDHHALAKEVLAVKITSGIWGSISGALSTLGVFWFKQVTK